MDRTFQATQRASEVARLSRLLHACEDGLSICSISGPGGVGKTYLVEQQVLPSEHPQKLGYIQLSVNAADSQTRGDFFGLVARQLAESSLPPPAQPNTDYFPQTRRVAAVHQQLVERAAAEFDAKGVSEETKERVVALLRGAQILNEMAPQSRNKILKTFRSGLRGCKPEDVSNAVTALNKSLQESKFPGQNLQDRVKRDLFNVTADALLSDLTSTIVGDKRRGPLKSTQRPIEGVSRLLIWLDDYEALAPVLGNFLVESLVPRLAKAKFPTLLIVACRDDLEATHPGWSQHAKRYLREQIRLAPFDKATAFRLLAEASIAEERQAPIYEATQGLPFLLNLAIEEATAPDAESALFAKKFFRAVFREEDVPLVQDWFEREASIRDPASRSFQMRPLVREKALRYLETRSPSRHREMLQKVKGLNEDDVSRRSV
jgi:hypothetical protein